MTTFFKRSSAKRCRRKAYQENNKEKLVKLFVNISPVIFYIKNFFYILKLFLNLLPLSSKFILVIRCTAGLSKIFKFLFLYF